MHVMKCTRLSLSLAGKGLTTIDMHKPLVYKRLDTAIDNLPNWPIHFEEKQAGNFLCIWIVCSCNINKTAYTQEWIMHIVSACVLFICPNVRQTWCCSWTLPLPQRLVTCSTECLALLPASHTLCFHHLQCELGTMVCHVILWHTVKEDPSCKSKVSRTWRLWSNIPLRLLMWDLC